MSHSSVRRGRTDVKLQRLVCGVFFLIGLLLLILPVSPVVVSWETASEVGTAGFNLYRAPVQPADVETAWAKVNDSVIPARGDEVVGASYRYEDASLTPGRRYRYRIEEVEWNGTVTPYPDVVVVRAGLPALWVRIEGVIFVLIASFLLFRILRRG